TGFPNQSLAVPTTVAERQALLQSLQAYFAANAGQENAPLNVTAARAEQLHGALSSARTALNNHLTVNGQKKTARDNGDGALRKRMRGLIDELGQLIGDDDARWYGFGLNPPGAPGTPDVPDAPVLSSPSAGVILVDWPDVPRAGRYRVWLQIVGTDADFKAI